MARIIECDNETCAKEIPPGTSYITLQQEFPHFPTMSADMNEKQFCSFGCVAKYAALQCGMKVSK